MEATNDKIKTKVIIILSIVFALYVAFSLFTRININGEIDEARNLVEQYRLEQRAANDTIKTLNTGIIRLEEYNRSAIGRVDKITEYTVANVGNTREAIRIIEQVIIQVKNLESELHNSRASINDMRSLNLEYNK
jgi:hypothetical protein